MPEQHALQHCAVQRAALSGPTCLFTLLKEHVGLETVSDVLLQVPVLPNGFTVAGEVRCLFSLCKTVVPSDWLRQLLQHRTVLIHDYCKTVVPSDWLCQLLQHRTVLIHDYCKTVVPSDWLCQLLQQRAVAACWNSEASPFPERHPFHSINLNSEMPKDS